MTIRTIVDFEDQEWPHDLLIPDSVRELLRDEPDYAPTESYNPVTGGLRLRFGGFLFEVDGRRILVDTGIGANKERSAHPDWNLRTDTSFLDSLRQQGFASEDVDVLVTTHMHVDHVGWHTVQSEKGWTPTFPRAEYVFVRTELEHWLSCHKTDPGVNFGSTDDSIVPIVESGRAVTVEDGYELASGVTMKVYPGHTPGNAVVWLRSGGETAVICGDTIHHPIQLRYPSWSSGFCSDPHGSAEGRRQLLDEVCETNAILLPNHFRTPPSRIVRTGDHYARVPLSS
ncbi:MBL fold metallo-hydrolase [Nonomuraea harbinensis]|uniref:MBL fold metallo-hydrolase n=1 Tax=Nonomuraea harbinensis TaxID=1286938 RepID=A0ABW1CAX9_9ACTN|nr:MBL fold metallo-hydrolase [Nonomuraea harbinensis]